MRDRGARSSLAKGVGFAVATSLLWAAAIVLVKLGLEDIPRLTFASLRYLVGAGALLIWRMVTAGSAVPRADRSLWKWLIALGFLLYGVVPAAQFMSLDMVEAVTFNLVFQAGIPLATAFLAGSFLKETTARWEWAGVTIVVAGVFLFYPAMPEGDEAFGILLAMIAAAGVGGSNALQRNVMRDGLIGALDAAVIPMMMGSIGLFVIARMVEPWPELGGEQIVLILILGVVNTALAFTLWHLAMRTLNALHAGIIASAQIVEVPIFAFIVLGESLTTGRVVGSVLVLIGILLVHFSKAATAKTDEAEHSDPRAVG